VEADLISAAEQIMCNVDEGLEHVEEREELAGKVSAEDKAL
jgi:hypothetical protein